MHIITLFVLANTLTLCTSLSITKRCFDDCDCIEFRVPKGGCTDYCDPCNDSCSGKILVVEKDSVFSKYTISFFQPGDNSCSDATESFGASCNVCYRTEPDFRGLCDNDTFFITDCDVDTSKMIIIIFSCVALILLIAVSLLIFLYCYLSYKYNNWPCLIRRIIRKNGKDDSLYYNSDDFEDFEEPKSNSCLCTCKRKKKDSHDDFKSFNEFFSSLEKEKRTNEPIETKRPVETDQLVETKRPVETNQPVETKQPVETEQTTKAKKIDLSKSESL